MVCQFLLYNKVNQLYIYIYPPISSLLHVPPILPILPLQVVTKHQDDLRLPCCFDYCSFVVSDSEIFDSGQGLHLWFPEHVTSGACTGQSFSGGLLCSLRLCVYQALPSHAQKEVSLRVPLSMLLFNITEKQQDQIPTWRFHHLTLTVDSFLN